MVLSVTEQITQLDSARGLVLADPVLYPQIVNGILPIVGASARLELRRWGADFLAETFASPVLASPQKEGLALDVLQMLKDLLEIPGEDTGVLKSVIQAAASIYGLVFRYIISNPHDIPIWNLIAAIKTNILKRWDNAAVGVRVCCIKFVQKVVQVQTPGVISDPRRPDQSEISVALVNRDHPLIPPSRLEPEASGLLDRLLNIFQEDSSDAILIDATLNCLGVLLKTRPAISNKIVSAILNFNPLKQANSPMNPTAKVQIKSMERTTRALLLNLYRRNGGDGGPFGQRIKVYVDRMERARLDIFEDGGSRKRVHPSEPTDGLDNAKRRRLGAEVPLQSSFKPLPPGPTSHAQLYTLTEDPTIASFDVMQLPQDLVSQITQGLLAHIEQEQLHNSIKHIRARLLSLGNAASGLPQQGALGDDDEDYEPDFEPSEDREQILNKADALPPEDSLLAPREIALGPFELPQPPPLTLSEAGDMGSSMISRVFGMVNVLEEAPAVKRPKAGLNRVAGSNYDREAWATVMFRLAIRAPAGLDDDDEPDDMATVAKKQGGVSNLADGWRESLWKYIVEDFRARISTAISWLNEEWHNDTVQQQQWKIQGADKSRKPRQHYERWTLKVLDGIVPYLDAKDKLLLKFLSEIPVVSVAVLERVKGLARDPERVDLSVKALYYLCLYKPPAKEICTDALEDLWRNYDDAKAPTTKLLAKLRPSVLPPPEKPPPTADSNSTQALPESKEREVPASPAAVPPETEQLKSPQAGYPVAAAG